MLPRDCCEFLTFQLLTRLVYSQFPRDRLKQDIFIWRFVLTLLFHGTLLIAFLRCNTNVFVLFAIIFHLIGVCIFLIELFSLQVVQINDAVYLHHLTSWITAKLYTSSQSALLYFLLNQMAISENSLIYPRIPIFLACLYFFNFVMEFFQVLWGISVGYNHDLLSKRHYIFIDSV